MRTFLKTLLVILLIFCEVSRYASGMTSKEYYAGHHYLPSLCNLYVKSNLIHTEDDAPFLNIETNFPNHKIFKDNYELIRDEIMQLYENNEIVCHDDHKYYTNTSTKNKWKKFYIKWYGDIHDNVRERCPKTCALIDSMPEVKLVMISILEPGGSIYPHVGVYNGALRYHLGLQTPNDDNCFIELNKQKYSWRDGEDVLFDDTYIHYVKNNTNISRFVLFADVQRKLKSPTANKVMDFITSFVAPVLSEADTRTEALNKGN